jgi:ribosome assembly protein YihI (activator of Der GTPase)
MYKIRKELQPTLHRTSLKNREELAVLLEGLDASMSQLISDNPSSADFMPLFADKADAIARQANAADHQWLIDRLDALLEKNGIHDDEYLPPHDLLLA